MSTNTFELSATLRTDTGKGASRRLRHAQQVPAIIYGANKEPQTVTFEQRHVLKALENEGFYSHILKIHLDGNTQQVVLKDLQRHPHKRQILHMDFLRISAKEKINMQVPLHFLGGDVAPGVKLGGGVISHKMNDVEVSCLPGDLPEFIEVDLSQMELDQTVHLSTLIVSEKVMIMALQQGEDYDFPVATCQKPKQVVEEEEAPSAEAEGAEKAEEDEKNDKKAE